MADAFDRLIDSLLRIQPASESRADDLITVRALGLRDVRRPRADSGALAELTPHVRAAFGRAADPQVPLPAGLAPVVERRGVVLRRRTVLDDLDFQGSLAPDFGGARATERFGPFIDNGSEAVWFDLIVPAVRRRVVFGADARPVLLFTAARLTRPEVPGRFRLTGRQGTVWVRADLLAPAAGASDYVGFAARSAVLDADVPATVADEAVTFTPPPNEAVLRLELAQPVAPEGGRCGDVDVTAPATLVLTWNGSNVSLTLGGGRADGPGAIALQFGDSTEARVDGRRIWFPAAVAPASVAVDALSNAHASFDGDAGIAEGGWSLPLTAANDVDVLPEAGEGGGWLLSLADPFTGSWPTIADTVYEFDAGRLLLGKGRYELSGTAQRPAADEGIHTFGLWRVDPSRKPLPFRVGIERPTAFAAGCHPDLGPYLRYDAATEPRFGTPIDARGRPLAIPRAPVHVLLYGQPGDVSLAVAPRGADFAWSAPGTATSLVLENAYLMVGAYAFAGLTGSLAAGGRVEKGSTTIVMRLGAWVPTLPDPYVANMDAPRGVRRIEERVSAAIGWTDGGHSLKFFGTLGPIGAAAKAQSDPRSRPAPHMQGRALERGLLDAGAVTAHSDVPDARTSQLREQQRQFQQALPADPGPDGFAIEPAARFGGVMLLDVSTNRHQIGVALGRRRDARLDLAAGVPRFVLDGLAVKTPLSTIDVFALPQIQWEPVYTLDKDQNPELGWFPTPLASPHDGGATRIASRAQTLVPVIPDLALEQAVVKFREAREPIAIVTTLPFGMVAGLRLTPKNLLARRQDTATFVRPVFPTAPPLEGALQLSIAGERGGRGPEFEDPSFEGVARQLLNGVDLKTGVPLGISVLGATQQPSQSVESFFNDEFTTGNARVPVTRYDISGYGASTFSDWNNPKAAFGDASKVQFSVIVGRTVFEIVKINSKLYPWGVSVTRSVTIERRGGGGVIRRDSGWQATSDGLFDFQNGAQASPYTFEPGLVEGVFAVRNIRSTKAGDVALPDGGLVAPMYIDGHVQLAGAPQRVAAFGLLAFLHLRHRTPAVNPGKPISAADLATLIERHDNRVGGPLEALLDVGESGFRSRATGIDIGVSRPPGTDPVFVGAVRAAPVFPAVGSWAVVRGPAPAQPPADVVGVSDGVPVLRSGVIGPPVDNALVFTTPRGDVVFADPTDLHRIASPVNDYGFLQATPTHRFLFRRPYITPGVRELRSTLPPAVADVLAACTSKGFFPPVDNAIVLPNGPYVLKVLPGSGGLRLEPPPIGIQNPRPELIASAKGDSEMRLDYSAATLALEIDETAWRFDLPRLFVRCHGLGMTNLCTLRLDIVGGTAIRPQLRNVRGAPFKEMDELLAVLPGFGTRPDFAPIDLAPTNLDLATKVNVNHEEDQKFGVPPVRLVLSAMYEVAFAMESKHFSDSPAQFSVFSPLETPLMQVASGVDSIEVGITVGFGLEVRIFAAPWYPAFLAIGCEAEIGYTEKFGTEEEQEGEGLQLEVTIYVGFGAEASILGVGCESLLAIGWRFVREGPVTGLGGVVILETEVKILAVKLKVSGEFSCLCLTMPGGRKAAKYAGELAINVEFAWLLHIKFTAEISEENEI